MEETGNDTTQINPETPKLLVPNSDEVHNPPSSSFNKYVEVCPQCDKHHIRKKKEGQWRCFTCHKNITTVTSRISRAKGIHTHDPELSAINAQDYLEKVKKVKNPMHAGLLSSWFLIGRRTTEMLSLKKKQIGMDSTKQTPVLKFSDVIILKKKSGFKTKNEKLQHPRNSVPVHITQSIEKELAQILFNYVNTISDEEELLFPITRQRAWQIVKQHLGQEYYPHWIRHSRVTDTILRKKWREPIAVKFFAWTDSRQLGTYAEIKYDDLAESTKE